MHEIEAMISEWATELVEEHPDLAPFADQLIDHVHCATEELIDSEDSPSAAVQRAIADLGDGAELAAQFSTATRRSFFQCTRPVDDSAWRQHLSISAGWILFSAIWVVVMFVVEESLTWALLGWTLTTFLPLSIASALILRRDRSSGEFS